VLALEERRSALGGIDNIDTTSVDTQRAALYEWRTVPSGFDWLATDPDGAVYAYMVKPRLSAVGNIGWNYDAAAGSPKHRKMGHISAARTPWQNSLEALP
jgi:hypothetical protein